MNSGEQVALFSVVKTLLGEEETRNSLQKETKEMKTGLKVLFTEGNEGNESFCSRARTESLFSSLSSVRKREVEDQQKETKIPKIFKIRDYDLCFLRFLL